MSKKTGAEGELPVDSNARLETSPEDKAKAKQWFTRGRELGDKRQFDYAVEYYVNGLEFWPDAVEEACKPLHGCAVARKTTGGKKPGLKDSMKRSTNDKNAKQAYVNALWLFGHDPDNAGYVEAVARNASRLRADDAAKWAGGVFLKSLETNPKTAGKQFQGLVQLFEELGDRAAARNETAFGVACYQSGLDTISIWRRRFPKDPASDIMLRGVSTKLTILKGKYEKGDSYRESIADAQEQIDLHDQQRSVQADDRVEELISKAEKEYLSNPESGTALKQLIDILVRRERKEDELRAINYLVNEFKRSADYRWKIIADDIRMKQLNRESRELAKSGDENGIKELRISQLRFELSVFKERVEKYPTDMRLRFELAVRRFNAGQFDEAIPLFQAARSDPKNRAACGMYLGRCFFRKNYFTQAIATLQEAISEHDVADDDLGKTMRYWLGRSQEANGDVEPARKTYGQLLQADYTFRDVRARLDGLSTSGR